MSTNNLGSLLVYFGDIYGTKYSFSSVMQANCKANEADKKSLPTFQRSEKILASERL